MAREPKNTGNGPQQPRASTRLYAEPKAVDGLKDFKSLIGGRGPDPLNAGNAFRNFVGDPLATEFVVNGQTQKLPEVVVDKKNFLPSVFLRVGYQRSLAVCRILVNQGVDYSGKSQPSGWKGTGFLVGPKLLLTNHHVLNSIAVAREAVCQFNYLTGPDGKAEAFLEFKVIPDELFLTSPYDGGLDYTFVAVEPAAAAKFGTIALERGAYVVHPGSFANIIQHPDGRPQEIVIHDNEVVADTGTLLHYLSDTDYGSSGSPVFDNTWKLIGLHHARTPNNNNLRVGNGSPPKYLNEGVKIATIATDLEQRAQQEEAGGPSTSILKTFLGVNSISGFFGTLGRSTESDTRNGPETVVDLYKGTDTDIDVGFWNIEWFSNRFREKVYDVATVMADFNLDIWSLSESSPAAANELVATLKREYGLDFDVAHSEPNAGTGKQSTSVLWNKKTVSGERQEWPADIRDWFTIDSRDFDDSMLEATHGRVFDRYPGLFHFQANAKARKPLDFFLVPLHLKAMDEGSLRRGIATKILAAAIDRMIGDGADQDWLIGGDYNAEIGSGDFAPLGHKDFVPISAEDERNGAITYVKGRYKSLIDHIYLSPNMARQYGPSDYYIVAADRSIPDYISRISDHRPVLARLSLGSPKDSRRDSASRSTPRGLPKGLIQALNEVYGNKRPVPRDRPPSSAAARSAQKAVHDMQSRGDGRTRPRSSKRR